MSELRRAVVIEVGTGRLARACIVAMLATAALIVSAWPAHGQDATGGARPAAPAAISRGEQEQQLLQRAWEIKATRVETALRLDGSLDDSDWERAEPITEFYQRQQRDVLKATERTEIRLLYDDNFIYIGIRAFESEPARMQSRSIFRDESAVGDDSINVMIDAYHGHRSAVQLVTNANGLAWDLLQMGENETTRNRDFDMVWESHGRHTPTGYEAEMVIPFKSLRFESPAAGEEVIFGIAFKRNITRKNEEAIWPYVSNDSSWYRPAEFGHVRGITNVRSGRNLEVRPYALAAASHDFGLTATDGRRELGLDVKWGVTTGLTADFTVNTDFAQEEVDVQQTNFTRFSLFFPEKRQFFLEGQQMFKFGVAGEADLAFTRRIGLSTAGEIVPILGGARLSGRQGNTSIGAMTIQTGDAGDVGSQNFSVLRIKRDLFSRSAVGAIITNVQGDGQFNRVYGVDASFFVRRVWFMEGFVAGMDETGSRRSGAGYGRFAYDTDRLGASHQVLTIGKGFAPAVGFVQRPDSRQHTSILRFSPRPESAIIRQLNMTGTLGYVTDQQNVLETRERKAAFEVDFEAGYIAAVTANNQLESISEPFQLRRNLSIGPGVYRFSNLEARFQTPNRRNANLNVTYATGGFWDGQRDTLAFRTNYRINTHVGVATNYDINWVTLPGGQWTTHLLSSRVTLAVHNDLAILSLFQYNHDTRQIFSNIRFNWIPKPGTDFFIVYNELDTQGPRFGPVNRSIAIKLNYLFAL